MSSLLEIAILAVVAAAAAAALFMLYGSLTKPVRVSDGQRLYSVLTVSGNSPELEQTVRGLMWLRSTGVLKMRMIVADCGMDEETREIAELLARDDERIILCDKSDLPNNVL